MPLLRQAPLLVIVLLLACAGGFGSVEKRGRLPGRNEIATTWIGVTEDDLNLVRLDLRITGEASVAYSFLDEPPHVLREMSWTYDPSKGSAIWIDSSGPDSDFSLRGDVGGARINLVISGRDWSRKATLKREAELESRWKRLRDAMNW